MSNEEEKRCPLCAEEMDWTDQQLKPCKCGYEVCVWCWHHIMDMAEKEATEGRCPACRTPYDKDRIVGLEANFQRVAANISSRKQKQPKAKQKTNEVKKDLSNVRVIQRKMAYIIGLPLSLADEDLLQRKDYFGQYGKVTKVSLSRTAGGTVQQFVNDTCSVYITYSKEEEAVRCIQSVHGYVLDGRFLRASFGTAKYCHAWLRNTPCNNPSCLYLHSIGAEEDSFGKDEIAAVHTRNRVEEIVGAAQYLHKRSGSMLPPPVDEHLNNQSVSPEEPVFSGAPKDVASGDHLPCFKDGLIKLSKNMTTFVDIVGRSSNSNSDNDTNSFEEPRILNLCSNMSSISIDKSSNHVKTENASSSSSKSSSPFGMKLYSDPFTETSKQSDSVLDSWGQNGHSVNNYADETSLQPQTSLNASYPCKMINDYSDHGWGQNCHSVNNYADEASIQSQTSSNPVYPGKVINNYNDHHGWGQNGHSVNNYADEASMNASYPTKVISDYSDHGWGHNGHSVNNYADEVSMNPSYPATVINGFSDNHGWGQNGHYVNNYADEACLESKSDRIYRCSKSFSNEEIVEHLRRLNDDDNTCGDDDDDENSAAVESSIISNILSMDFDGSNDSVLPKTVAELFEGKDGRHGSSWNYQNNDQSRFSFANEQGYNGQELEKFSILQDCGESQDYTYKPQYQVSRAQNLTPPGFSKPPPGFPPCTRTEHVASITSGSHLVKNSSSNHHYRKPSLGNLSNSSDDLIDPAIMVVGRGKPPTNGFNNPSVDEETKLWLLMQQQQQPQYSQTSFTHHHSYGGLTSRLVDQHQQSYINPPPQYLHGAQQAEQIQRNKLLPGYNDYMFPGDVYTRVFGM